MKITVKKISIAHAFSRTINCPTIQIESEEGTRWFTLLEEKYAFKILLSFVQWCTELENCVGTTLDIQHYNEVLYPRKIIRDGVITVPLEERMYVIDINSIKGV